MSDLFLEFVVIQIRNIQGDSQWMVPYKLKGGRVILKIKVPISTLYIFASKSRMFMSFIYKMITNSYMRCEYFSIP